MIDDDKRCAAEAAVAAEIRDGMLVGLGTGSTAAFAIAAIARQVSQGMTITAVATSEASAEQARAGGIRIVEMADVAAINVTIDGADEIDDQCRAIKGAGGAMTREKIVAAASRRMVVIADGSKRIARLSGGKVPVEILAFAHAFVEARLVAAGAAVALRRVDGAPYRTDSGNIILDAHFLALPDPDAIAEMLDRQPGVVGHGLFLSEVSGAYIAQGGIVSRLERSPVQR